MMWGFSKVEDIEDSVGPLKDSLDSIEKLFGKVNNNFALIKGIAPELGRLVKEVSSLEEYHPHLQDSLHQIKDRSHELNRFVEMDIFSLLDHVDVSAKLLKRITFDADALFVRENKLLDRFVKQIRSAKTDEKLSFELVSRINFVKQDMKSVTRCLFEASRALQDDLFDPPKLRIPLAEKIKLLGIAIDDVARVLEKLDIDDIEDVVRKSEQELVNLKKLELEAILGLARLERYLTVLNNKLFLLDDDSRPNVEKRLFFSVKLFSKVRSQITKSAEKLFKNIKIFE